MMGGGGRKLRVTFWLLYICGGVVLEDYRLFYIYACVYCKSIIRATSHMMDNMVMWILHFGTFSDILSEYVIIAGIQ